MLFNLEEDHGSRLRCYLIPDAGGATPALRLLSKGRQLAKVSANVVRPEIVASGRHATGLCGFNIGEGAVPNLSAYDDLELREAETGLLIYRRPQPRFIKDTKMFRLETHLLPLTRFDDTFKDRFQIWYKGIDRQGLETAMQTFMLSTCFSLYVSGRLQFQTIEVHLRDFKSIVLMRDPYDELAERLLVLRHLPDDCAGFLGERDLLTFKVVIDYLRNYETLDARFCKNFIRRAPDSVLKVLSSPMVRLLSSANPDEIPKKNALAAALQALSCFDVVGVREHADLFSSAVQDDLGLDETPPVIHEHKRVRELGDGLRRLSKAEMLLEHDLDVFEHVKHALATAERAVDRPQ